MAAAPMWFDDLDDASIGALCAHPPAVLDERLRRQTSFFDRLERDNPAELAVGLEDLRMMLHAGQDPRAGREAARAQLGDASVLSWQAPEDGADLPGLQRAGHAPPAVQTAATRGSFWPSC